MRRRGISWPAVVLVGCLLAAGVALFALRETTLGASVVTFAVGLVTPLRLAAPREQDGGPDEP